MGNIEYKYKEATIDSLVEENEEAEVTPTYQSTTVIPNQCWGGYYNKSIFDSTRPSPSFGQNYNNYKDFGVSIQNYGCAVCCCVGAYNRLYAGWNKPLTVYDLWIKNCFVWNQNIINKKGQPCGPTLAIWNRTPGVSISTDKLRFDDTRAYPFTRSNSYYQEPSIGDSYASQFYVPSGWSGHYELTTNYKKKQVAAMKRIEENVVGSSCCILYICNSTRNAGHYVLAYDSTREEGQPYKYSDILVYDPCPSLTYFNGTAKPKRSENYYGARCTLEESMKRINSDLSDGIRTVAVCTTKSQ